MNVIRINSGRLFPKPFIYLAYVLMIFGLFISLENIYGIAIILVAAFIVIAPQTIELITDEKLFRKSLSVFGFRFGKWNSYDNYPFISLISSDIVETTYGGRTNRSISVKSKYFILCLLSQSHRSKIVLKTYKDKTIALEDLEIYSQVLNLKKTVFNPQISLKTKNRKI